MAIVLSFIASLGLSALLAGARGHWQVLDIPNERSLHSQPTPRTGGIAILAGLATGGLVAWWQSGQALVSWPVIVAVTLLAAVAQLDDRHTLGPVPRLAIQLGVVALVLTTGAANTFPPVTLLIAGLFLMWMINLYNFMDGMDGFAGGMALIGFGTFAVAAGQAGDIAMMWGCGVIAAAAAGFLILNFPPARLFMGDTGSTVLGLLAGLVILSAHASGILPLWLGLLTFSPFIIDASVTLARRLLHGERVWEAHKTHYYQRLVEFGWGHRRTVLAEYALMLACSASALLAAPLATRWQTTIIALWAVIYITLMYRIHRAEQRRDKHS
jgi:UDP-N-acetylmuramyl pentapeptide phosphotransferase/UDP-N-acetylglucosamine-1-phosphate transferase